MFHFEGDKQLALPPVGLAVEGGHLRHALAEPRHRVGGGLAHHAADDGDVSLRIAAAGAKFTKLAIAHESSALRFWLLEALEARLQAREGKDVKLKTKVDPEILGGLVVRIGSQQIDSSIRTRLNTLAQAMKG